MVLPTQGWGETKLMEFSIEWSLILNRGKGISGSKGESHPFRLNALARIF